MKLLTTTFLVHSLLTTIISAATLPYFENFDSYDNNADPSVTPTGFSESRSSDWSVQDAATGNDYRHALTEINNTAGTINLSLYTATLPVTNAVGNSFTMTSSLRIDAASATTTNSGNSLVVGLNYLGSAGFSPGAS